jgi:small conductance mechanosensitive channel
MPPELTLDNLEKLLRINYLQQLLFELQEVIATFGLKLLVAIIIAFIGFRGARLLQHTTQNLMRKASIDETLVSFAVHLTYFGSLTFVAVIVLGHLGIQTTAIIAALTSGFFAVGLALQGSLSNFAAGVLIIIFRPFRVNDYIEGGEVEGTVEEIQILTTKLRTLQNIVVVIPNSKLTNEKIINYSSKPYRRIDLVFGVSYRSDIDQVKQILWDIVKAEPLIAQEPPPFIGVLTLNESSVDFAVRPYVRQQDYWTVWFNVTEAVKKRFDANGIQIPFPQRDVHLFQAR